METTLYAENFDLDNSLLSSFACYLFNRVITKNGTKWVGLVNPIRGAELAQHGNEIRAKVPTNSSETLDYLTRYVTGLWHTPEFETKDARAKKILASLSKDILPGIRVPRLHHNRWHVLISAMLSIHARMSLSRSWFASLTHLGTHKLTNMSSSKLGGYVKENTGKSAGFRMRFLTEMIDDLHSKYPDDENPLDVICSLSSPVIRLELMSVRNIGPKVCDCFLLNAVGDIDAPPVDIHVKRVSEYLGILPPNIGQPIPSYCRKFACSIASSEHYDLPLCPRAERTIEYLDNSEYSGGTCARAALNHKFKEAGWVQALLFLFGQKYCVWKPRSGPACHCCPLKEYCSREDIESKRPSKIYLRRSKPPRRSSTRPEFLKIPLLELYPTEEKVVHEKMREILKEARQKKIGFGVKRASLNAACLWLACRHRGLPVLIKEVVEKYSVKASEFLRISYQIREKTDLTTKLVKPSAYCERFRRLFGFPEDLVRTASFFASKIRRFSGSPVSLAAASIYLASKKHGGHLTMEEISQALMISSVTIRNVVKKLVTPSSKMANKA